MKTYGHTNNYIEKEDIRKNINFNADNFKFINIISPNIKHLHFFHYQNNHNY